MIYKYSCSIKRTYGASLAPVIVFFAYSDKSLFTPLFLLALILIFIYCLIYINSLFIFRRKNLLLSESDIKDEKRLYDLLNYLPIDLSYISCDEGNKVIISFDYKKNIYVKDILKSIYPTINFKYEKSEKKFEYSKYVLIGKSDIYRDLILSDLRENNNIKIKFFLRNPYKMQGEFISFIKIESDSKNTLDKISKKFILKKDKSLIVKSENIVEIFKLPSNGELIDIDDKNFEIRAPREFYIAKDSLLLGTNFNRKVYLGSKYLNSHSYIVGKTGSGKSTFMKNLIIQNLSLGKPLIVIDPHNICDEIYSNIDHDMKKRVVFLDFKKPKYSLNLMENLQKGEEYLIIDNIVSIFKDLYEDFWGPQTDDILRRSVSALIFSEEKYDLSHLEEFLTDEHFRLKVLYSVSDKNTLNYFNDVFSKWDNRSRMEKISPLINKIGRLKSDKAIYDFISGKHPQLDILNAIKSGKSIFISTPKSSLGSENSKFLGSLILNQIKYTLIRHKDIESYIYIDEFQNFLTENILFFFSEGRKFGIYLTVANQYTEQIDKKYLDVILENISNFYILNSGERTKAYLSSILNFKFENKIRDYFAYSKIRSNPIFTIKISDEKNRQK
jgi:DNA helicase HerA-like ATPase